MIVIAGIALLAKPIAHHLRHAAVSQATASFKLDKTGPTTPAPKPTLSRARTTVLVLNGNGVTGAAATASRPVRRLGYSIKGVGNAQRSDYPKSVVMFRPGLRSEAVRFARDLDVKIVGPLDGVRIGELHGARLVYVVAG